MTKSAPVAADLGSPSAPTCRRRNHRKARYRVTHAGAIWDEDVFGGIRDGLFLAGRDGARRRVRDAAALGWAGGHDRCALPQYAAGGLIKHPDLRPGPGAHVEAEITALYASSFSGRVAYWPRP